MEEITSLIGDVLMKQTVFLYQLLIVLRTGLGPAQLPLDDGQLFLRLPQPPGGIGRVPVIRDIKVGDRIFQADGPFCCGLDWLRLICGTGIKQIPVVFSGLGPLHGESGQLPTAVGPA